MERVPTSNIDNIINFLSKNTLYNYIDEYQVKEMLANHFYRFTTRFDNGVSEENWINGERVNPVNSCFAGYVAPSIQALYKHLADFFKVNTSAHGINSDMIYPAKHTFAEISRMAHYGNNKSIVALNYSSWNVNILPLLDILTDITNRFTGLHYIILIDDKLIEAAANDAEYDLYEPSISSIHHRHHIHKVKTVRAKELYNKILFAVQCTSPSIINADTYTRRNMCKGFTTFTGMNICTEEPSFTPESDKDGFYSCTLASINVSKFYKKETNSVDWELFETAVRQLVFMLNIAIAQTRFNVDPSKEVFSKQVIRPIGVGIRSYANLLMKLGIAYEEADVISTELACRLFCSAHEASQEVARLCPEYLPTGWKDSEWAKGVLPMDFHNNIELNLRPELQQRLDNLRGKPIANLMLIAYMPNFTQVAVLQQFPSILPPFSLVFETTHNELAVCADVPEKYLKRVFTAKGSFAHPIYRSIDHMDKKKIARQLGIFQVFCDKGISGSHAGDPSTTNIRSWVSAANEAGLGTLLYYWHSQNVVAPCGELCSA